MVENYLGKQKSSSAYKWQSGPNKPPTELAYITEAEKKLLLKEDIHGSLKDGPNKGRRYHIIKRRFSDMEVDHWSDIVRKREGPRGEKSNRFRGGALAAGATGRMMILLKRKRAKNTNH